MDKSKTVSAEQVSLDTPLFSNTREGHGAPPTLRKEASVARRLDESFNESVLRTEQGTEKHRKGVEGDETSAAWLAISEMRKMTEEFRRRDEEHRLNEMRKDEDIRRLIDECQRKDEIILSLISSVKEQMSLSLSSTTGMRAHGGSKLRPESELGAAAKTEELSDDQKGGKSEKTAEVVKVESPAVSGTSSEGPRIQSISNMEQEHAGQTTTVKKEALEQVSTGHSVTSGAILSVSSVAMGQGDTQCFQARTSAISSTSSTDAVTLQSSPNSGVKMRPATFDGSSSWIDYKTHFDMCAELNKWDNRQKGLYLAVSLRGQAQGVLGNLPVEERNHFDKLSKALAERFSPDSQTELYRAQLKERQWKHGENIPEFGQRILRLTTLAYPGASSTLVDTLAMGNFIDAISDAEMRLKIQQSRPKVLNEAVKVAVELEAFDKAERQRQANKYIRGASHMPEHVDKSKSEVSNEDILKRIEQLLQHQPKSSFVNNKPQQDNKRKIRCYKCKEPGHIQRNCPLNTTESTKSMSAEKDGDSAANVKRVGRFCDKSSIRNRKRQKQRKASVAGGTGLVEAGMYLPVCVNGIKTNMLIDSGATASLLSTEVYQSIPAKNRPNLKPIHGEMVAINGMSLEIFGYGEFNLDIGGCCYPSTIIVAKLNTTGILGLDFLSAQECNVNMKDKSIDLDGKVIKCTIKGKMGCYRVSLLDTVSIPPRHELVTSGRINEFCNDIHGIGIIEPTENFNKALVGRTLTTAGENVPIRLMNPLNESVVVHRGTVVGQFEQVESSPVQQEREYDKTMTLPKPMQELLNQASENLNESQTQSVHKALTEYGDVFALTDKDLGRTDVILHEIDTDNAKPVKQRLRRLPHYAVEEADRQVEDMLNRGIVEPSNSPWAAGVVLVKKKDNTLRFCVDYRALNALTTKDAYPLPKIDETLDSLSGASWFSTLDLRTGYWQVGLDPKDKPKTAFITRKGLFQFRVLPFGLCNAPATFERLMETVLSGLQWDICLIYIDDVIVYGKTFEEALENLKRVFTRLREAGLKLKPQKCKLFSKSVSFLGHIISEDGVATDYDKIKVVQQWPIPVTVTEVRSFLGLCSYYRRFIPGFAKIARPLHQLTEKGRKFVWTNDHQTAFESMKKHLTEAPILVYPDFSKPFILDTDASDTSIGAILSQVHDGKERVICYGSRSLSKSERKYCVTRKELLSLIYFVKYYRHYLLGKKFKIRTDHNSLRWLMKTKEPEGQLARWIDTLSSYQFEVEHRPGRKHSNADAMSRIPCRQCGQNSVKEPMSVHSVMQVHENEKFDIGEAQKKDKDIALVISWLQKNEKPSWSEVNKCSALAKSYWSQYNRLQIENDILCRNWFEKGKVTRKQKIVPKMMKSEILKMCHDEKTGGHFGVRKTLAKVRNQYYWAGLQGDVRNWVKSCEICSKRKSPNKTKRAPMQLVGAGYPMERIATDIMGPLPETIFGNKYILVISDYFTKWVEAIAIPDQTAITVAAALVEEVVCKFGTPAYVHSDQGRQFEGTVYQEMCRLLNIKKTRTTPYHPQSDGMVERYNKTLAQLLGSFINEDHTDWDQLLPYVMMAYRSSEHETTGFTPNMMMLGREIAVPLDIQFGSPVESMCTSEWVNKLKERLDWAHDLARNNIELEMVRQKRYHDTKLSWESFNPGQKVYIYFPVVQKGTSRKLTSFWRGPFLIIDKLSDLTYRVRDDESKAEQVVHIDRMKQCHSRTVLEGEQDDTIVDRELNDDNEIDLNEGEDVSCESHDRELELELGRGRRTRKLPTRFSDYVL